SHVDGPQGGTEKVEREQEENDSGDRPAQYREGLAASNAERVADFEGAGEQQHAPCATAALGLLDCIHDVQFLSVRMGFGRVKFCASASQAAPLRRKPMTPPITRAIPRAFFRFSFWPKNNAPRMTIPTPETDVQIA